MFQSLSLNQLVVMVATLLFAVTLHEVAHGYAAYFWGDETALRAGRLSLNPLKHLDLVGSILLPGILLLSQAPFVVGYAKPVPVNPANFRDPKKGGLQVSGAGIAANLACALVAGWSLRLLAAGGILSVPGFIRPFAEDLVLILGYSVIINAILAAFNLIPIPPLDGGKILAPLLPQRQRHLFLQIERFGLILIVFLVITGVLGRIIGLLVPPIIKLSLGNTGLNAFIQLLGELN